MHQGTAVFLESTIWNIPSLFNMKITKHIFKWKWNFATVLNFDTLIVKKKTTTWK